MTTRVIQPVSDNFDKQRTYQKMHGKYRMAMKYGFYLEAILIDYAMLEDRLRAFIYYIGGLYDRDATSIKGKIKRYLSKMVRDLEPKGNLGIMSISGKMRIVKAVLCWEESSNKMDDDRILKVLRNELESLDIGGLLDTLNDIKSWCDYRNECIHSVMNKNMDSLGEEIAAKAEDGMTYVRFLESQVKILKGKNRIRPMLGLTL